jgi:uncharacterized protein (TIGR03435 family)
MMRGAIVLACIAAAGTPTAAVAQSIVQPTPQQPKVEFEVVSIRPHAGPGVGEGSNTRVLPGGRITGSNVNARKLIRNAFGIDDFQMSGAPGWVDSESYDFEAKTANGVEITRDNIEQLILGLLETRFQLRWHRETKELTEYALEVAKGGPKVTAHSGESGPGMSTNSGPAVVTFKATKISMTDFAAGLRRQLGRPVVDKTGLVGEFDFALEWSPDQATDGARPSLFTALQTLGLRLVTTKGSAEIIVIDDIQKATDN